MSIVNGAICSSNESYGDLTSDTSNWFLSTKGSTIRICTLHTPTASTDAGWKRAALTTF